MGADNGQAETGTADTGHADPWAPRIGVEGLRAGSALLALAAVGCVVMAGATLWNAPPADADPGQPPGSSAWPLAGWLVAAVLALCASVALWALLPQDPSDEPGSGA